MKRRSRRRRRRKFSWTSLSKCRHTYSSKTFPSSLFLQIIISIIISFPIHSLQPLYNYNQKVTSSTKLLISNHAILHPRPLRDFVSLSLYPIHISPQTQQKNSNPPSPQRPRHLPPSVGHPLQISLSPQQQQLSQEEPQRQIPQQQRLFLLLLFSFIRGLRRRRKRLLRTPMQLRPHRSFLGLGSSAR